MRFYHHSLKVFGYQGDMELQERKIERQGIQIFVSFIIGPTVKKFSMFFFFFIWWLLLGHFWVLAVQWSGTEIAVRGRSLVWSQLCKGLFIYKSELCGLSPTQTLFVKASSVGYHQLGLSSPFCSFILQTRNFRYFPSQYVWNRQIHVLL